MNRSTFVMGVALLVLACGARPAGAQTVAYSEDFNGGPAIVAPGVVASFPENPAFSGRGTVGAFAGYGPVGNQFGGLWLRAAGTNGHTLTLTGLPAHSTVSVGFLLGILDTWDILGPETLTVKVDGITRFSDAFGYGGEEGSPATGAVELVTGLPGPGYGQPHSTGYDLAAFGGLMNIPHTNSSLTVTFDAVLNQFGEDESWSMDNLRVILDETSRVPEPDARGLLWPILGACALVGLRRRREPK